MSEREGSGFSITVSRNHEIGICAVVSSTVREVENQRGGRHDVEGGGGPRDRRKRDVLRELVQLRLSSRSHPAFS